MSGIPAAAEPLPSTPVAEVQAFFGPRAARWDTRFAGDEPQFRRAVAELAPAPGTYVLDAGCGTGRALSLLRAAVGPSGRVVGVDATPEMLAEARRLGRRTEASLVLADVQHLPLVEGVCGAIFAGGLLPHLDDPLAALRELARVALVGAGLAVFHPIGRIALAARHRRVPADDDVIAPRRLTSLLETAGWRVDRIDDAADRYLALATRA